MTYLFFCKDCHKQYSITQKLLADHSGKLLVCPHCNHKKLIRVYTTPLGIKTNSNAYKLGVSNPFANIKN